MKRNKFSKALKHLKSKKIDEKIKSLEEAAPTNNMSGVYQVTPSTGDAFRMGELDPAKKFYPKADGTWPAGIPADPSDREYVRGAGYHTGKGAIPDSQNNTPRDLSLAYMNANGNDTTTMIRASDGAVYADLPEGTRSFILGPLVTSYNQNHTYDDFTNLGYIQKDTRQFVLLAQIQGFLDGTKRLDGAARTWDGTATQFVSYNSNFTIEHALWMRDRYNEGNFTANVPFNLAGGVPADRHPDDASKAGGDVLGTDGGPAGSDSDDDGKNQDPADENDIESLDLWGLIKDVLDEIGDRFKGVQGILDAIPPFLNFLAHQVNENSPWTDDNPFPVKLNEQETDDIRNDIKEIFNEWGNERVDEINDGSPMTPKEQNEVNEKINRNKNDGRGDALDAEYPGVRLTINNIGKPDAFKGNIKTNKDGSKSPIAIDDNYVFEGDDDASAPGAPGIIRFMLELPGVQSAIEKSGLDYPYRKDQDAPIDDFGTKPEIKNKNMPIKVKLETNSSFLESYNPDRKRILREIRQPLKEIQELPKTTKLKGYRPNFKGKYSPQNTPDVTASKQSDDIVSAKNASRQVWTAKDKFWKGYETTERMNIIYDNLGHGSQYFDRIVGENVRQKNKKSREVQEHLNMLAHQKAMREVYGIKEYENFIDESETFDNKINDPLFTKVAKRLKKEIDYPKKPAAKGYPNEAPPKVDPNSGYHPKFGKRYKYDKLDPISAKTMAGAPTGDPEIDANVKKAAKVKEDWRSDLKNLWLGSEREEWKNKIEEGMTTQVLTGILPSTGDADLETVNLGVSGGHAPVNYGNSIANSEEDPNTIPAGTEYTALTNLEPMNTVVKGNENDWTGSQENEFWWLVRTFHQDTQTWDSRTNGGDNGFFSNLVPGFKEHTMRNVKLSGRHSTRDINHPTDPGGYHPTSTFGSNDEVGQLYTGSANKTSGAGVVLNFNGSGSPRFVALRPVDATQVDTIKVHALLGDLNIRRAGAHSSVDCRPQIYYWAGNHPDFQKSYLNGSIAKMSNGQNMTKDGWRPINMKPNGDIDPSVDPFFIKYREDEDASGNKNRAPGYTPSRYDAATDSIIPAVYSAGHNRVYPYSLKLPEWTQTKDARFMLIQHFESFSPGGSSFHVSGVRYQRKSNMKIPALTKPLTDIETSPFVRVGPTKKNEGGKERKKKVKDIIDGGLKYTETKFSKDFPVRTTLE